MNKAVQNYIFFDLDGTLTDSQEGIVKSLQKGLASVGIEKNLEELKIFIGPPLYEIFTKSFNLSKDQSEIAVKNFRAYFSTKGLFENKLYQGIPELLKKLRQNGKRLLVATSKPEEFAVRILEHFKIAEYFDFICGSTMDEKRTAKADVIFYALKKCGFSRNSDYSKDVLMVGDRYSDVKGAKEAGIESCYVMYGYGSREEAEKFAADYLVESVKDLGDFLCGK